MFTSFLFEPSSGAVDLAHHSVHALGNWKNRVTVTTPEDIGRLAAAILFAEPGIVDQGIGRRMRRVGWSVADLKADLAAHPDDALRKYRLVFARDSGVA